MIKWKKYDPENPPNDVGFGSTYITTDGQDTYLCYYDPDVDFKWISCHGEDEFDEITHYAEINLPGEVDHE